MMSDLELTDAERDWLKRFCPSMQATGYPCVKTSPHTLCQACFTHGSVRSLLRRHPDMCYQNDPPGGCGKPSVAWVREVGSDGTRYHWHRMCRKHAEQHDADPVMEVEWDGPPHRVPVATLRHARATLARVMDNAPGYDWNADPLQLTRMVGNTYEAIDAALREADRG